MNRPIQVIKIINDRLILINAGSDDGITREDTFGIFQEGVKIVDPISRENLGTMDLLKAQIGIAILYPKMALCENVKIDFSYSPYHFSSGNPTMHCALNVDPTNISGGFGDSDRIIRLGDLVKKN